MPSSVWALPAPGKPPVVDLATWQAAREELLVRENAHTREGDAGISLASIASTPRCPPLEEPVDQAPRNISGISLAYMSAAAARAGRCTSRMASSYLLLHAPRSTVIRELGNHEEGVGQDQELAEKRAHRRQEGVDRIDDGHAPDWMAELPGTWKVSADVSRSACQAQPGNDGNSRRGQRVVTAFCISM
jgi:hypothetical protein